jgi:large subunit ribosomal protein L23
MALLYPVTTEKAVGMITKENKMTFVVAASATRTQVKKEVEDEYGVKVERVNIIVTPDGRKKAIVKMKKGYAADDIAAKLKLA